MSNDWDRKYTAEDLAAVRRAVGCPSCQALPGEPCKMRSGGEIEGAHIFRVRAFAAQGQA
jgi:hypothetical protein